MQKSYAKFRRSRLGFADHEFMILIRTHKQCGCKMCKPIFSRVLRRCTETHAVAFDAAAIDILRHLFYFLLDIHFLK
mgnify:CR=1 FL=1